jgi:hypothetical protein
MSKTKFSYIFFFLFAFLMGLNSFAQNQSSDSLMKEYDSLKFYKRISIGPKAVKNLNETSIKLSLQFLTYINWRKFDLGLGVNYEDEIDKYLIPAYVHFSFTPDIKKNPTKIFLQSGLAFNLPRSGSYDHGKPGALLGLGIEQHFRLFNRLHSTLQFLYRLSKTTMVEKSFANQQPVGSSVLNQSSNRFMLVFGVNF